MNLSAVSAAVRTHQGHVCPHTHPCKGCVDIRTRGQPDKGDQLTTAQMRTPHDFATAFRVLAERLGAEGDYCPCGRDFLPDGTCRRCKPAS
jgi:hypothetical protein